MHQPMINGLYAITPSRYANLQDLLVRTEQIILGGARAVQYREKSADEHTIIEHGTALKTLCADHQIPLILNDHVHLVKVINADGVHLGQQDLSITHARTHLGQDSIIGISCHDSMRLAVQAQEHCADYVAFGSFYASHTKPHAVRAPLSLIQNAHATLSMPIVAIGGITANNAKRLIQAGAHAVAVLSWLYDAPDPRQAAQEITALFESTGPNVKDPTYLHFSKHWEK